ncbi:MAG: PorV/PorQ family protein [Rhodothermaceae bacterium]
MKFNKIIIKLLFASLFLINIFHAQTKISKYAGEFLTLGAGGRAMALGGANVALVNDVTAGYWNPAGLINVNYPQFSLLHEEHFGSLVNYNYAGIAIPYKDDMSFAFNVIRLSIDGIPDTRKALYDKNGDGIIDINIDGVDYSKITEFNNTDWAFFFSFAKRISEKFSWGASVKLIRRDLAEYSATGIGFDIGAIYKASERLTLGANIQDVTTTLVAWDTGRNELISPTMKLGGSYLFYVPGGTLTPVLDVDVRFEDRKFASTINAGPVSFDVHSGMEYQYKNLFAVRAGYSDVKQLTLGAGLRFPKLNIDYSFARFTDSSDDRLEDSHRISLMFSLDTANYRR